MATARVLVLAMLASGACGDKPTRRVIGEAGDTAFVSASVVTMTGDGVLDDRVVLVHGDRVVAIEKARAAKLADGVAQIDARGKWLMPGLADMHVHVRGADDVPRFVAAGVTTVRNMWGRPEVLDLRKGIAAGDPVGPTIVTAGPIVDGDPPALAGSRVLADTAGAAALVAEHQRDGYDFIKVFDNLDADAYAALAKAAGDAGLDIAGHVPSAVGIDGALAAGQDSFEHLDGWDAVAEADRPALIARMGEAKARITPTLVVQRELANHGDPRAEAAFERSRALVPELVAAGATLLVGTDAGNPGVPPGASMWQEIELLVDAGVPRDQVLRAAAAGTVAVDAVADLVLLDANPLEEPVSAPAGVMLRGRWLPRAELDALVPDVASARDARLAALPAFDVTGAEPIEARYVYRRGDTAVGDEVVTVARTPAGPHAAARLVMDFPYKMQVAYRIVPGATDYFAQRDDGTVRLSGKVARGALTASGTGADDKPVSLSEPFGAGAFLTGPGIGGVVSALHEFRDLDVGETRELASKELAYFPEPSIQSTDLVVERRPDQHGNRHYAVTISAGRRDIHTEVTVGHDGLPLEHTYGPPLNLTVHRIVTTR